MSDQMKLTPAQQAASIDRVRENIALLSGAGCGKTFVLARRITELLLAGGEDPLSRLVALTFTEKAATEMLQRIRKMLSRKAEESRSPDRERIHQWLLDLPKARISTIHSFCSTLLRSHAVEAGLDPGFNVCSDELLQKQMLRNAIDQTLLESVEKGSQETAELLQQVPYDRAMEHIELLIENRTTWRTEEYANPEMLFERWQTQLAIARNTAWRELTEDPNFLRELNRLESAPCRSEEDKLNLFRHETLAVIRTMLDDPDQRREELLSNLSLPGNKGSASNWAGKEAMIDFRDRLKKIIARMKEMAMYCEALGDADRQAARLLVTFSRLAHQANKYYIAEKRQRGLLDFNDLIQEVHALLSENPTLARKLSESFDQLLIDEAQDTDRFQIELLKMLVSGQSPPETLPPGRLFLVGDSKQSIYRFRGAQVDAFENLCHQLGERQQEKLDLSSERTPPEWPS